MAWNNNLANIMANERANRENLRAKRDIAEMRYGDRGGSRGNSDGYSAKKDGIEQAMKMAEMEAKLNQQAADFREQQIGIWNNTLGYIINNPDMDPAQKSIMMQQLAGLKIGPNGEAFGGEISKHTGGLVDKNLQGVTTAPYAGNPYAFQIDNIIINEAKNSGLLNRLVNKYNGLPDEHLNVDSTAKPRKREQKKIKKAFDSIKIEDESTKSDEKSANNSNLTYTASLYSSLHPDMQERIRKYHAKRGAIDTETGLPMSDEKGQEPIKDDPTEQEPRKMDIETLMSMIYEAGETGDYSQLDPELQELALRVYSSTSIGIDEDGKPKVFHMDGLLNLLGAHNKQLGDRSRQQSDSLRQAFPALADKFAEQDRLKQEQDRLKQEQEAKQLQNDISYVKGMESMPWAKRAGNNLQELDNSSKLGELKQKQLNKGNLTPYQIQNIAASTGTFNTDTGIYSAPSNAPAPIVKSGGSGKQPSIKEQYNYSANTTKSAQYKSFWDRVVQKHGDNSILQQVEPTNMVQVIDALTKLGDVETLKDLENTLKIAKTTINGEEILTQQNRYNDSLGATDRALATNAIIIGMDAAQMNDKKFETDIINNTINTVLRFLPEGLVSSDQRLLVKNKLAQTNSILSATIKNIFRSAYVSAADIADLRRAGLNTTSIRYIINGLKDHIDVAVDNAILGKANSPLFYDTKLKNAIQTLNSKKVIDAYEYLDTLAAPDLKGSQKDLQIVQMPTDNDYSKLVVTDAKGEKMYVDTTKQPPKLIYARSQK